MKPRGTGAIPCHVDRHDRRRDGRYRPGAATALDSASTLLPHIPYAFQQSYDRWAAAAVSTWTLSRNAPGGSPTARLKTLLKEETD